MSRLLRPRPWIGAWIGVAGTYVYFLLFSEFSLLRIAQRASPSGFKQTMGLLGVSGIAGSIIAWRIYRPARYKAILAWALLACAAASAAAGSLGSVGALLAAAAASGIGLGMATVTLATGLVASSGRGRLGLCVGAGTGLAYAFCNLPVIFSATDRSQCLVSSAAALAAASSTAWMREPTRADGAGAEGRGAAIAWLALLAGLVALDSSAFALIQSIPALKARMWEGDATLWANAAAHGVSGLLAGLLLDRGRAGGVLAASALLLGCGCLLSGLAVPGAVSSFAYASGVSAYSATLVFLPARRGKAGASCLCYTVAGWLASAVGLGIADHTRHFHAGAFLVAGLGLAAAALLGGRLLRRAGAIALLLCTASQAQPTDPVAAGRLIYIREGCIHCHSQYVRPTVGADVVPWGPAVPLSEAKEGAPPLLGNRRQGPDLSNVGNRRSAEWERLHLADPQALVPRSRMPSYAYLFGTGAGDGEALVAYLASLGHADVGARLAAVAAWKPDPSARVSSSARRGAALFAKWCAVCHGARGEGNGPMARGLSLSPPNWPTERWRVVTPDRGDLLTEVARVVKFGVPGTPMAGHEYFSDEQTLSLALRVLELHDARP